ncbi:hypothetical protein BDM02DRAFT_3118483 [Thelephora ganbajun]|uniref:Uncharacterized protein n=1 Tax=Thelephora ganbajun TaxID=370292 RepID=A0ACB6ZAZ1_THEGA|nr:hypothetical protein BDM02DRAFT_3118483 [Thelephora ganbajun]
MAWFKKSKKSRQPPQPLASLGIPTHIAIGSLGLSADLDLGISSQAANNGRVSLVGSRDRSGDRRLHASGASTPTHGREDGVTLLLEREHEREVPSNAPNQQLSYDIPDLSSAESQSEVRNRVECEDRGTVTRQPPEPPPERISKDHHIGEDVDGSVQLGSRGEWWCSSGIPAWINSYQFQRESIETRHLGPRPLQWMPQRSPHGDSVL